MLLEIYDIDCWKSFFDLIHDSASTIELKLDQEKCGISLLNNSHVCFYTVEYSANFFSEYQVDDIESVLIFVADFYNIIKTAKKNDRLELSTTDTTLKIVLEHDMNRRVFEIPLAEDYGDSPTPPNVPINVYFEVKLKDLKQPCADLDKIVKTDRFKMIVSDELLEVVSPSDSMTKYNQRIMVDNTGSAESIVNLGYIEDLQKLSKVSDTVVFGLGENMPLVWSVESPDELVKIDGMIAPIIEDTD